MPDDAEIEVVKDSGGIFLKDKETNAEYYIKESMDEMMNRWMKSIVLNVVLVLCMKMDDMDEEVMYEIEMDEDMMEMVS